MTNLGLWEGCRNFGRGRVKDLKRSLDLRKAETELRTLGNRDSDGISGKKCRPKKRKGGPEAKDEE